MALSINLDNLKPGSTYNVQVKGLFFDKNGEWSNVYTFTTPSANVNTTNAVADIKLLGGSLYAGLLTPTAIDASASGVIFNQNGLFGYNAGSSTFYITASNGNAYFAGLLAATTGSIGGWIIQTNQLSSTSGTGKNLFSTYDPSFESSGIISGLNYWTALAALNTTTSKSSVSVQDGTFSLRVSTRNPALDIPDSQITSVLIPTLGLLTSGSAYTFSGYVRANNSSGNPSATISVLQYDSTQTLISTTTGTSQAMSGWTRASASFTASANTAYVSFIVNYSTDGSYTVAGTFTSAYYDAMQLEAGTTATTYEFSGFTGLYGTTSSASQYKIKFGLSETSDPTFSVDIFGNTQAKSLFIGNSLSNQNLYIDTQSIQSQYSSSASKLYINKIYGGDVYLGNTFSGSITSYSVTANTVTVTIADTSKLRVNDPVTIAGTIPTSGTSVNGSYSILTIPTKTTFTYYHPTVSTGTGSGGTYTTYYASNLTVYGNLTASNGYITINGTQVNLGGTITVSASPSASVTVTNDNTNNNRYITFVSGSGTSNLLADTSTGPLTYNPSTGTLYPLSASITPASAQVGLSILAAASQSANLQEWKSSSSTVLASVNPSGLMTAASFSGNGASVTGVKGLYNGATLIAEVTAGSELTLHRVNSASEGGQINFNRSTDDTTYWNIDVYGSTASPTMRWIDSTPTVRMTLDSANGLNVTGNVVYNQSTNSQSGSAYTLALTDAGKFVEMTSSAANTITVPAASAVAWTVGTRIDVYQYGAGTTTIAPASGVTINYYSPSSAATRTIKARYGAATLIYRATNEWLLIGNLT